MVDANIIEMNPEQVSMLKACGKRIENLRGGWVAAARQAGAVRDQLKALEASEAAARQSLEQAEIEFDSTMKEIAVELGHENGQSWKFNQDDFTFIVEPSLEPSSDEESPADEET